MSGSGFSNDIMHAENVDFTGAFPVTPQMIANGQLLIGAGVTPFLRANTLTAGTGVTITNGPGTITIAANGANDLHTARFIVSSLGTIGTGANYGTISAAITAVQATGAHGTIFVMPGTYTENLTVTNGINIVAFDADAYNPNVTIVGKISLSTGGNCCLSGIRLKTNGDYLLLMTGSTNNGFYLKNCYLDVSNFDGISLTTSGGNGGSIILLECEWNVANDLKFFDIAAAATSGLQIYNCIGGNSFVTTTNSTISSGFVTIQNCFFPSAITTSGTATLTADYLKMDSSPLNFTMLTLGGSGAHTIRNSSVNSGNTSALSIGNTTTLVNSVINSTNTNAITGAGTIQYAGLDFSGSSSTINTTTQTPLVTGPLTKTKALAVNYVSTAISYQVLISDEIIGVTDNSAARTITMPNAGLTTGQIWTVKDEAGTAGSANAIIISGNGVNIDASATFQIASNYGAANLYYNGTQFFVF